MGIEPNSNYVQLRFKSNPTLDFPKTYQCIENHYLPGNPPNIPGSQRKAMAERILACSYFLATTGQGTLEMLNQYVERQGV